MGKDENIIIEDVFHQNYGPDGWHSASLVLQVLS